jgi:hypothetical protein
MATIARSDPISFSRSGSITFEDFCAIIKPEQKADLIDGVIFMASPESLDANDLFLWLVTLIRDLVEDRGLGKVYGSRVAFRMGSKHGPEPDIGFVRKDRLHLSRKTNFDGKGEYREVRPIKGEFSSRVLDGFRLRPEWLWQTPRPARAQVLALLGPADRS